MSGVKKQINEWIKYCIGLTGQKNAICVRYFHVFGKLPNLKSPVTFNEKINAYKLLTQYNFEYYADKVRVKEFVTATVGIKYVIPTYFSGTELPPVSERNWPIPYVIKYNHCSGWNMFIQEQKDVDWFAIESKLAKWKVKAFGPATGEIHYSKIEPQVLVEAYISEHKDKLPYDYKLYVFNGRVEFIEVVMDRGGNQKECHYDIHWNKLPFSIGAPLITEAEVNKPELLDEMITVAETLGKNFPFVRVDLYLNGSRVLFGELTFMPGAGFTPFYPNSYDELYGAKLTLTSVK